MNMSAHAEEHFAGSNKLFISIWGWLIALTLVEIFLAYRPMPIHFMLTILLGLSIIKAALIIAYFMHMKFEVSAMKWVTMSSLVFCLAMMLVFLPDAFRILHLGVQ
jgi:cytochrome c oxidase subunit 4